MMTYKHLSKSERNVLFVMKRNGRSLREISQALGRAPSSLSRELNRNKPLVFYNPLRAQDMACQRLIHSHHRPTVIHGELRRRICAGLKKHWSPEIISGRLLRITALPPISHEAIYQWIYRDAKRFIPTLTRHHHKRRPHHGSRFRLMVPHRISVHDRPPSVLLRQEPGHWESDLIIGCGRSVLSVSVERKTLYTHIRKLPNKTAQASFDSLRQWLAKIPPHMRRSVTYDNGKENYLHHEINQLFEGLSSYFCEPSRAWEKPIVENTNGLIRRIFPKRTNFDIISEIQVQHAERWINRRPRKVLDYQTSAEAYANAVALAG